MSKADFSSRAGSAYTAARGNQYIRRLIEDEDLRASIIGAAVAARSAYGRVQSSNSSAVEAVTSDRKVRRELSEAVDSLREASARLQAAPRRKRHPIRNLIGLTLLTGGLVLVFSESARKAALDAVFGAEEEFVYTSTTTAPPAGSTAQTNGTPVAE
ncbi:MAG: hypothetical protein WD181_03635 [Solirubrobacterales bacterium]